ncbi:glycosyltransferase family 4 protein [Dermabacteraceae bacterium P13147]
MDPQPNSGSEPVVKTEGMPARTALSGARVCHYTGLLRLVAKSGLGVAVQHQKKMYRLLGIRESSVFGADVAHLNSVFPDTAAVALLARARRIPVVMHAHSTEEDFRSSFRGADTLAPLFRRWITWLYSLGDVIITPTDYSRSLVTAYGVKRPIVALSNGIDTETFRPDAAAGQRFRDRYSLSPKQPAVVSVGHLFTRKGIDDFVALAHSLPEVRFIWFGDTPASVLTPVVKAAIASAPENLTFAGFVPPDEVRDAYCGADVFCFLSREETEGIVVLEALACGIPTIVRDIGVFRPWLVDGESAHVLAADPADSKAVVAAARERIKALLTGTAPDTVPGGMAVAHERGIPAVTEKLGEVLYSQGVRGKMAGNISGG